MSAWDPEFEQAVRRYLPFLSQDEPLNADTSLRDHGLDSLATVELLAELERHYRARFVDDALTPATFQSPGTLWAVLSALLAPVD